MSDRLTTRLTKPGHGQSRYRDSGRYGYTNNFERLCVCGHTLGVHTAQAPHECIAQDFEPQEVPCQCQRFRPAK